MTVVVVTLQQQQQLQQLQTIIGHFRVTDGVRKINTVEVRTVTASGDSSRSKYCSAVTEACIRTDRGSIGPVAAVGKVT